VDLVQDHEPETAQQGLAFQRGEEDVQALWRGDEDVRRMREEPPPFRLSRVPAPYRDGDLAVSGAGFPESLEIPLRGRRRFSRMSVLSALRGET
jgi:hypothetical protein